MAERRPWRRTARSSPVRLPDPDDVPVVVPGGEDHDAEFTAFVHRSSGALVGTAWLLCGDVTRAEDLVQHALLRTYLAWPRVRDGNPLAYARRVVANARTDAWRKHRREVLTAPADMPAITVPSDDVRHAERDRLTRALATLTVRQRRVVVLRHLVGLTEAEVAADLGITVGTVKSTASRALRRLEEVLEQADQGLAADGRET